MSIVSGNDVWTVVDEQRQCEYVVRGLYELEDECLRLIDVEVEAARFFSEDGSVDQMVNAAVSGDRKGSRTSPGLEMLMEQLEQADPDEPGTHMTEILSTAPRTTIARMGEKRRPSEHASRRRRSG